MPAHGRSGTIGHALRSDGRVVTAADWRANRLADALAKVAAGCPPMCQAAHRLLTTAEALVAHECAMLGAVTFAANNHTVVIAGEDGRPCTVTRRDTAAARRTRAPAPTSARPTDPPAAPPVPEVRTRTCSSKDAPCQHPQHTRRAVAARRAAVAKAVAEEARAQAVSDARAASSRPSSLPPARERLAALRERLRGKWAAASS